MSRLPQVNGDKGNWGKILNTWLKHIAGYRGVAPARPASGSLPSGVAINGNGYDTTDQYQSENSGLNFHNDFPANAPTGFTFIHTLHNRIYRKEGNSWAVLLEGVDSSNPYWSLTGNAGTNPNSNFLGTTDNQPLVFRTNNSERVRIDTNGNVGIGTTTPSDRLDVQGNVRFSGALMPAGNPGTSGQVLVSQGSGAAPVWQTLASSNNSWSLVGNSGTNPANNFLGTTDNQPLVIRTSNTERVRIDTNGNVGIGIATPAQRLDVNGNVQFSGALMPNGNAGTSGQVLVSQGSGQAPVWQTLNTGDQDWLVAQNSPTGTPGSVPDSINRWIYTNGNVGIGTTNPGYKLEVLGGWKLDASDGSYIWSERYDSEFDIVGAGTKRLLTLHANTSGTQGNLLEIHGHNGTSYLNALTVTNAGNVGIGTTNPSAKLEVIAEAGKNPIASLTSPDTSTNRWVKIGTGSAHMNLGIGAINPTEDFAYIWSGSDKFMIGSDGNPTLVVSGMNNGNVGIGTTNPGYKLEVLGGWKLDASDGSYIWSERYDSEFDIVGAGTKRLLTLHANTSGTQGNLLEIHGHNGTSYLNALTVTNAGNVGIGTTAPANALHVSRFGFNPSQNDAAAIRVEGNWGGGIVFSEGNNRSAIYSPSGSDLIFATGGSSGGIPGRVHIDSIGRVGVNTYTSPHLDKTLIVYTPWSHIDNAPLLNWGNSQNAYLWTYGQFIERRDAVNRSQTRANNSSSISAFRQDALYVVNAYSTSAKTFMNGVVTAVTMGPNSNHPNVGLHGLCETHMCMQTGPMHPQGSGNSLATDQPPNANNGFVGLGCRFDLAQVPNNCRPLFINCFSSDNIGPNWNDAGHFLVHARGHMLLSSPTGAVAYKNGNLTWANASDARLKTNIQPITNALEKITKLRGVSFDWVNQDLHQGDAKSGFLAQEMEQVFPDCVQEVEVDSNSPDAKLVGDGKIKTVGLTTGFFASIVEAIKEQQQIIEGLQKTVAQQQQLIDLQNQKIAQLEQKLEELANKRGS